MSFYWSVILVFTQMPCKQVADCSFSELYGTFCVYTLSPSENVGLCLRYDVTAEGTIVNSCRDGTLLTAARWSMLLGTKCPVVAAEDEEGQPCWMACWAASPINTRMPLVPTILPEPTAGTAFSLFPKLCFRSFGDLTSPRQLPSQLLGRQRCRRCQEAPERQRHQEGQDRRGTQALHEPHLGRLCWCRARLAVLESPQEGEWRHRKGTSVECPLSQPNSCVSLARFLTLGGAQGRRTQAGEQWGQRPCVGRMGPGCRSRGSVLSQVAWSESVGAVWGMSLGWGMGVLLMRVVATGVACVGAPEQVDSRWKRRSAEEKAGAGRCWWVCVEVVPACIPQPEGTEGNTAGAALFPLSRAFIFDVKTANTQGTRGSIKRKFCLNWSEIPDGFTWIESNWIYFNTGW